MAHRLSKLYLYMLIVFCLLAYKAIRGTPEIGILNLNLSVNSGSHSHKCQWFYVITFWGFKKIQEYIQMNKSGIKIVKLWGMFYIQDSSFPREHSIIKPLHS